MSGASSLSMRWVRAPKQAYACHLELLNLLKRVRVNLTDQSMRIPAYRYQPGIQAPQIPLGGASLLSFVRLSFELASRTFRSLRVKFTLASRTFRSLRMK